jgi:hypothetical protein
MFVTGKYQWYLPLFIFFLSRSYLEHDLIVVLKDTLQDGVREQLEQIEWKNYRIFENVFEEYDDGRQTINSLRWMMYLYEFEEYENIYIGDIDILIVQEEPLLLERHLKVCADNGTCYSNTIWIDYPNGRGPRMTGLHFFKTQEYFKAMLPVIKEWKEMLLTNPEADIFWNEKINRLDNQMVLYKMIKESGLKVYGEDMRPPNVFFEYSGLHLGHSRVPGRWAELFKNDNNHVYYYQKFIEVAADLLYEWLYNRAPGFIQYEIGEMVRAGSVRK